MSAVTPGAPLPRGGKDLLPAAARRRRVIVARLLEEFEAWGFRPVVTPMLEFYEVLARGLTETDRRACVRFIGGSDTDVVALRSDVTPQIARIVAERHGVDWPSDAVMRFAYAADVVRRPTVAREQSEYHQVGVELVGESHCAADAELIALADAVFAALGVKGVRFDLSHRGIARGTLDALHLPGDRLDEVMQAVIRKDRPSAVHCATEAGASEDTLGAIALLCDGYGSAVDLERAKTVITAPSAVRGLEELQAVRAQVEAFGGGISQRIDVDLGELRGFDYYSGIRIRAWVPGASVPVLRGGRYDDLIARYGASVPATGFALDLDALENVVPEAPQSKRARHRMFAIDASADDEPARRAAAVATARARSEGDRTSNQGAVDPARVQQLAVDLGADAISMIRRGPDGSPVVEQFVRVGNDWTQE